MSRPRMSDLIPTTVGEPFDGMGAPDRSTPCCAAAAASNGRSCTCWTSVLRPARRGPTARQEGPAAVRPRMCGDCAYRPGSPERTDNDGQAPTFADGGPFYCHDGMPRAVAMRHPALPYPIPTEDLNDGHYQPDMGGGRVWQADGTPGVLCAGWAAVNGLRPGSR